MHCACGAHFYNSRQDRVYGGLSMRAIRIIGTIFGVVGAGVFVAASVAGLKTYRFVSVAERAQGRVVELVQQPGGEGVRYAPKVAFVAATGLAYEIIYAVGRNAPAYEVGDTATVLYHPHRPLEARLEGAQALWVPALGLGGLALVLGGVALGALGMLWARRRRVARLRARGCRVAAAFHGVERNFALQIKGRHPFRVVGQWQDPATARVYVYHSENLRDDPTDFIDRASVPVFIDPADPGRYYMDLSFLPRLN